MKRLYHYPAMLILTIITIICILVCEVSAFVRYVVFDPNIYAEAMVRGRIGDIIYDDLVDYFNGFSGPTGIPAEVFTAKLDSDTLMDSSYQLTVDSLTYLTDPNAPKPEVQYDFADIESYVDSYIIGYTEANGFEVDDDVKKLIENTHKTIESQITGQLDVTMMYTLTKTAYAENIHKFSRIIERAVYVSGIIGLFLVMIMVVIDRKHPRDLPYWFGVTLFSSGAIVLFPSMYLQHISYFDSFFMRTDNVYKTVTGVCKVLLNRVINTQTVVMIFGVFLILLTVVIHMIYINYLKKKHHG